MELGCGGLRKRGLNIVMSVSHRQWTMASSIGPTLTQNSAFISHNSAFTVYIAILHLCLKILRLYLAILSLYCAILHLYLAILCLLYILQFCVYIYINLWDKKLQLPFYLLVVIQIKSQKQSPGLIFFCKMYFLLILGWNTPTHFTAGWKVLVIEFCSIQMYSVHCIWDMREKFLYLCEFSLHIISTQPVMIQVLIKTWSNISLSTQRLTRKQEWLN